MRRRGGRWAFFLVAALLPRCWPAVGVSAETLPPLYVTVVVHAEEDVSGGTVPKAGIPDYDGSEPLMRHFAAAMRAFAQMAAGRGARINFGSDWTFSLGAARYEPAFYPDLEAMGHEIDAHAHESFVRYHEVRKAIVAAGGRASTVASGLNEAEIQDRLAYFDRYAPEFRILWGVAAPGHAAGECVASWVWRPSRDDWTKHDPNGDYIYIGHGELVNSVQAIRRAVENRRPGRVNAVALFTTPREFKAAHGAVGIEAAWTVPTSSVEYWANRIAWWDDLLTKLRPLVDAGVVRFATLSEIAAVFEAQEAALSFDGAEVPRSTLSMRERNARAGYPLGD